MCQCISVTIIMRGLHLIEEQVKQVGEYKISVQALDSRCSSLKVTIAKQHLNFQQYLHIYDFIDIKKKLKSGMKLQEINKISLLFLKLMISSIQSPSTVLQLEQVPLKKIIKGTQGIGKTHKSTHSTQTKAIALLLSKDIAVILPKLLAESPQLGPLKMQEEKAKAAELKIKEIFQIKG